MCQPAPERVTKHEGIKKIARSMIPMSLYRRIRPYYFRIFGWGYRPAETTKARPRRLREGFFEKYCQGGGLDVGFGGDPITPDCKKFEYEHGDAQYIKSIKDNSFDFVYTSHVIEHMVDPVVSLQNWWRAVKPGGYLLLYLPHRELYEKKKTLPSLYNPDHKHFFLIDRDEAPDTIGIIPLIKKTLPDGEIIYAKECSEGHTIVDPLVHSDGEYSIEVVVRKKPTYMENGVEIIKNKGVVLAVIIYNDCKREKTEFFTPADFSQQLAFNTHKKGETIQAHVHNPVPRNIQLTQEVLFMKKGTLKVNIYNQDKTYFDSRILHPGDTILFAAGGHGFEFLENVEMIEVKQGPYAGENDKTWFNGIEKNDSSK